MMKTIIIDGIEYNLVPKEVEVYSDWRLPSRMELLSLVDHDTYEPASFDKSIKSGDYYWSSTTDAGSSDAAWYVHFGYGYSGACDKSNSNYVRFVRDGTNGLEWSETLPYKMSWEKAMELAKTYTGSVTFRNSK
jgi:hypothetical protein